MEQTDQLATLRVSLSCGCDRMIHRVYETARQVGDQFPYYADPTGKWIVTSDGDWCGGHWVGMLWIAYQRTGDVFLRNLALRLTDRLAERLNERDMFRGVIHYYSAAIGADVLGEDRLAKIAIRAAEAICSMYNPCARMIPLGHSAKIKGAPVSGENLGAVDNAMVPLMVVWWAWQRTQRSEFAEVATAVAEQVCCWFLRQDGSTWQAGIFDPKTGELVQRRTVLGYSEDSCWSRGQSWLLYGLAIACLRSPGSRLIEPLTRVLRFYNEHVPENLVPYYDFTDPRIPDVPRDTSAAALAAAGLSLLSAAPLKVSNSYRQQSESIVNSLLSQYMGEDGRLQAGCFNFPDEVAPNNELIWGSFYLMETLHRLTTEL